MYRAVMICDLNNPISVAYSKIALDTWKDVKNVEVERFQCYTPDTLDSAPFKINWGRYSSAGKYKKNRHEITPTEKSCLTSMFHWWKHIAETDERVIILEHDAYVTNPKKLMDLVDFIPQSDLWCPGIAMECATLSPHFAKYCMKKWLTLRDRIDAGPMAELWTAISEYKSMKERFNGKLERQLLQQMGLEKRKAVVWPTIHSRNLLGQGNDLNRLIRGDLGLQNAPVTQCYYPGKNTLVHHDKLGDLTAGYSGGTLRQMHILETLYERKTEESSD